MRKLADIEASIGLEGTETNGGTQSASQVISATSGGPEECLTQAEETIKIHNSTMEDITKTGDIQEVLKLSMSAMEKMNNSQIDEGSREMWNKAIACLKSTIEVQQKAHKQLE